MAKRDLNKVLVSAGAAVFPEVFVVSINIVATATDNFPLIRAPQKMKLISASLFVSTDADGDKTAKIRNLTRSVDLTANLDVDAIAADSGAAFVPVTVAGDLVANAGDLIALVYTVTTAGTVQPGISSITTKWQLM